MTNIAVILAGGLGKRFGEGLPKQLRKLEDGRTVLQTCIDTFRACPSIKDVYVVMHPDWIEDPLLSPSKGEGVVFIPGGDERWQSSWNAINWLMHNAQCTMHNDVNVLIHDAARPFVSERIIEDVCQALETHEAVTVAIPSVDTMYQCTMDNAQCTVSAIPDRSTMWRAQTPQAFRLELIKKAYDMVLNPSPFEGESKRVFTDDCGIVHQYLPDTPIYIVEGDEQNRKITFKEDIVELVKEQQ